MTAILGTFFAFNILNYAKTIYAETKNENEKTASVEASTWSSASTGSSLNTGLNSQRTIDRLESSEATILAIGSSIAEVTTDRITNIGSNQISTLITEPLNTKVNIETSHFTRDSQSDSYPTEITVLSQSSIHDTKTSKSITNDIGTWPINSSSQVPTNNIKTTISVTAIGRTATTDNDPSQSSPNNIESTDSMESTRETELQTATITSQSNTTVTLMSDPVTITTAVTVNDRTATTNSNPTQSSLINTETTNSRFTMDKTRPTKPRTDTVTSQGTPKASSNTISNAFSTEMTNQNVSDGNITIIPETNETIAVTDIPIRPVVIIAPLLALCVIFSIFGLSGASFK